MDSHLRKLTDEEFGAAIVTLREGVVPYESPEMLQRFAETIISKLWLNDDEPGEDG